METTKKKRLVDCVVCGGNGSDLRSVPLGESGVISTKSAICGGRLVMGAERHIGEAAETGDTVPLFAERFRQCHLEKREILRSQSAEGQAAVDEQGCQLCARQVGNNPVVWIDLRNGGYDIWLSVVCNDCWESVMTWQRGAQR